MALTLETSPVTPAVYDLSKAETQGGTTTTGDKPTSVVLSGPRWAYGMVVRPHRGRYKPTDRLRIKIAFRLRKGAVGIGILERGEKSFYEECVIDEVGIWSDVEFTTPPLQDLGPLVLRNARDRESSEIDVRVVYSMLARAG